MKSVQPAVILTALVLGGAVAASPVATADPSVVGTYTFEAEDGETATWNMTACPGDAPGCVRIFESGNPKRASWNGEAHYSVGSWILFVQQADAILCEDGTSAPGRNTYSWDNATLSGNVSIMTGGACGGDSKNLAIPFRLAKTGSVPAPPPAAPAPVAPVNVAPAAPAPGAPAGPVSEPVPPPPPATLLPAESLPAN